MRLLFILFLSICFSFHSIAQEGNKISAKSVVKIISSYPGPTKQKVSTSSGWCWKNSLYIVTTLHSVAGASKIVVKSYTGKTTTAKVLKVVQEGDLALLKLSASLGLKPLALDKTVRPNSEGTFYIWGYPHGIHTMQRDKIEFSISLYSTPILSHVITGDALKSKLIKQGYPLPKARIFRVSSIIKPGHSGAPIMTRSGHVIAIADGGLRGGSARINWAMPANYYVNKLLTSTDTKPSKISLQSDLYAHTYEISPDVDIANGEDILERIEKTNTVNGSQGSSMHKSWTTSFRNLYSSFDDETQAEIKEMIEDEGEDFNYWLDHIDFDIYEDPNTGIAVPVPVGFDFAYDQQYKVFSLTHDRISLSFMTNKANSFQGASNAADDFARELFNEFPDAEESDYEDDYSEYDADEKYRYIAKFRDITLEDTDYLMICGGEVEENYGVYFVAFAPSFDELDDEEYDIFLELSIASEMISFNTH